MEKGKRNQMKKYQQWNRIDFYCNEVYAYSIIIIILLYMLILFIILLFIYLSWSSCFSLFMKNASCLPLVF